MKRGFLSALIMIAMVSSLISPACAFMSGSTEGFIEICTSDGQVRTISVPGEQAPSQDHSDHETQPECAFCFAAMQAKSISAHDIQFPKPSSSYVKVSAGVFTPRGLIVKPYQAQGPPSFI